MTRLVEIVTAVVVLTSLTHAVAAAQSPGRPVASAVRAGGPIRIDGSLSEPSWTSATPIGPLLQREPREGQPASEATVKLQYTIRL
jgi:hypothetical protein